jgi:hypothetical protein
MREETWAGAHSGNDGSSSMPSERGTWPGKMDGRRVNRDWCVSTIISELPATTLTAFDVAHIAGVGNEAMP